MTMQFSLIVQTNKFFILPFVRVNIAKSDDDFTVFSVTWLYFNLMFTTRELLSTPVYWRLILANLVNDNVDAMHQLDALVNNHVLYTDTQFIRKARYIVASYFNMTVQEKNNDK